MARPDINLIIPDVHLKMDTVQRVLDKESYDKVFFLGDFFDDWNDNAAKNAAMAQKLNEWMAREDCHFIYGNHDVHYIWNQVDHLQCSGFEEIKSLAINNFLNKKLVVKKFNFHHVVDGILLTHAGLHPCHVPNGIETVEQIDNYLTNQTKDCIKNMSFQRHWFTRAGYARGGSSPIGGILWLDFFDEFTPIPKIRQMVGHTFCGAFGVNEPQWKGENLNIDTAMKYYAKITEGKVEIKRTLDIL